MVEVQVVEWVDVQLEADQLVQLEDKPLHRARIAAVSTACSSLSAALDFASSHSIVECNML